MKDVQLYIDGNKMEIDENAAAAITLSVSEITNPDTTQMGHTKAIDLPATPHNRIIMRFTEQVFSVERFNNAEHIGVIESNGIRVMSGIVELKSFKDNNRGTGYYSIVIIGSTFEWIKRAKAKIGELTSDYSIKYQLGNVYANSVATSATLIKFAPIDRGAFYTGSDLAPRTSLAIQDYHPFINVMMLLELILKGYTVVSSIRERLSKLYVSGYIPELTDDSIKEDNDFYAGSTGAYGLTYHIRSYFDTKIVFTDLSSGDFFGGNVAVYVGLYPINRSYMAFAPTTKITASFEINLAYSTTVAVRPDGRLDFVNKVFFSKMPGDSPTTAREIYPSAETTFTPDDSTGFSNSQDAYPEAGDTKHYILFIKFKNPSLINEIRQVWSLTLTSTQTQIILSNPSKDGDFCLYVPPERSFYTPYIRVYYKTGATVDLDLNDKSILSECYFIPMDYFDGKHRLRFAQTRFTQSYTIDQGEKFPLTLSFGVSPTVSSVDEVVDLSEIQGCTIKPIFKGIGIGDDVSISTIGGEVTQLEFIQAIRQMFNLNFYTNSITKEVFIEPGNKFYKSVIDKSVRLNDWTQKIDYLKDTEVVELGSDIGNSIKLAYKEGGDVIKTYNRKNKTDIGTYTESLQNKIAGDTKEIINPLYSPSVLRTVDSMGFSVIQCALETEKDTILNAEMNIDPIIVHFGGLAWRTAGSDKNTYPMYPLMLFQSHAQGVNIGFDDVLSDSGSIEGLRQYYGDDIELWNHGRRIILYAKLEPRDIEPFLYPNKDFRDFRGRFKIKVNGEDVLCRIEKISDYDPNSGDSTKIEVITGVLPFDGEVVTTTMSATWTGFVNVLEWVDDPGPEPTETATATWIDFVNVLEQV